MKQNFGTLQKIYSFVSSSLPRLEILKENIEESENDKSLSLKRHSDTRWSSRRRSVDAVVSCLGELHTSLVQMVEGKVPLDPSQFAEAHSLINQIESFNFHFLLHCWQKILTASDILSKYLQSDNIDIGNAVALINGFRLEMNELRSNEKFGHFKEMATKSLGKLKPSGQTVIPTRQTKTGQDSENHLKVDVHFALQYRIALTTS